MKVLLAVDLRNRESDLVGLALPWIERLEAVVDIVYVDTVRAQVEAFAIPKLAAELQQTNDETAHLLAAVMQRLPEPNRGQGIVDVSTVPEMIELRSADYALILVGTRGLTGLSHWWAGSVAEGIIRLATTSVLVLRAGELPTTPSILWAVDPSENPQAVLSALTSMAARLNGVVNLVTVVGVPLVTETQDAPWLLPLVTQYVDGTQQLIQKRLDGILSESFPPSRRGVAYAEVGTAVDGILTRARGHDLVVVGTHVRSAVEHVFVGSVAERVARRAGCAVLVVRVSP